MSHKVWRERAGFGDLRSVIDPADASGSKNAYIDLVQKTALDRHFPIGRKDVVLDFGCGVGRFTDWLEARAAAVIGIDAVSEMIDAARRLHPNSKCRWMTYSDERLPLNDSAVDRILSVWVLQHVLDDIRLSELVSEFARVLKPGGAVAIIEQVAPTNRRSTAGYIEQRNLHDYDRAFRAAGFEVEFSQAIRSPSRVANGILMLRPTKAVVRALAASTLALAPRLAATAAYSDQLMVFRKSEAS